jgi:hypothetical protein
MSSSSADVWSVSFDYASGSRHHRRVSPDNQPNQRFLVPQRERLVGVMFQAKHCWLLYRRESARHDISYERFRT